MKYNVWWSDSDSAYSLAPDDLQLIESFEADSKEEALRLYSRVVGRDTQRQIRNDQLQDEQCDNPELDIYYMDFDG